MKNSVIKQEIKKLAAEQVAIKPQRKTFYFVGERTIDSSQATLKALLNKQYLRHLYVAYDVLRGREVVPFKKREFHQSLVDAYVEKYKQDFLPKTEE